MLTVAEACSARHGRRLRCVVGGLCLFTGSLAMAPGQVLGPRSWFHDVVISILYSPTSHCYHLCAI
jgi:hypothetical protein